MNITLVDNLLLKRENDSRQFILQPHLGLISLIAVLENHGYTASLYDPKIDIATGKLAINEALYRDIAAAILDRKPDMVGFTSLGCNFICTLKIARYLKHSKPGLPILLGGPHATVLHREIITTYSEFDVIVRNEAEQKIIPVIQAVFNGGLNTIEGITYREGSRVIATGGASIIKDLDELPLPAYHAYPVEQYSLSSLRVEAGRGCPFSCTFCSTATFFGRSYRLKPAKKLCAELDFLHRQYGITDFGLTHDLFTVNKKKVMEFCREVAKRKYTWRCSARMDCVDRELLTMMRNAGCVSIYYGIETGSQRMQKISKKKLDLDIFAETLEMTLALNIVPTLSFIVGYPEENMDDVNATLDMLGTCMLTESPTNMFLQLHLLTPEPGTALHDTHKNRMGFDDYITDFNFPTLEHDDAEIMESNPGIFMNHHYYESILPRHFFVITASLFETMRALGPIINRYILSHFENSLSKFNADVYSWAVKNDIKSMNNNLLVLYMGQRFSAENILTSLVRYQFEVINLMQSGIHEEENSSKVGFTETTAGDVARNPQFRLLKNIHNCPGILKRLQNNKKITSGLLRQRNDLIIHLYENRKKRKIVESYKLDGFAANMLKPIAETVSSKTDEFLARHL